MRQSRPDVISMYTKLPNVFVDNWIQRLAPTAVVIYLAILRQTTGYHREADAISISQLAKKTGMCKNSILRSIKILEANGLILREQTIIAGQLINRYTMLDPTSSKDEPGAPDEPGAKNEPRSKKRRGSKSEPDVVQNMHGGGAGNEPDVVQNMNTHKEREKENSKEKKKTDTPKRRSSDPRASTMPILVYREIVQRSPNRLVYDEIISTVDDEERWRSTLKHVIVRGWNPTNIQNVLRVYREGIGNDKQPKQAESSDAIEARRKAAELYAARELDDLRASGHHVAVDDGPGADGSRVELLEGAAPAGPAGPWDAVEILDDDDWLQM